MSADENATPSVASGSRPVFGRYVILDTLGGGGMASVYRASQRGLAGSVRTVALKVIHPHLSGEDAFVRMFLDEMRVAMALQHRNIVQTLDAGEVGQRHYIAMELVSGFTLRQVLTRSGDLPIPLEIALFVAAEISAALHYAHTFQPELTGQPAAVVHRDVSPSNVLLSKAGDVKLMDFGVARARDSMRQQSVSDAIKGKLAYMPPEQARGQAVPASDIFALGATLYELLSKRSLRQATTLEEVLDGPTIVEPIHPSRPDVSPELDVLLSSCLDPDPKARPRDAAQLEQTLREFLGAELSKVGLHIDMRTRLASYLATLPDAAPSDPAALRLAQALLVEAQASHSLVSDLSPAPEDPETVSTVSYSKIKQGSDPETATYKSSLAELVPPGVAPPRDAPVLTTEALRRETRSPWPWIVLFLGVFGIGGGLTVWYLSRDVPPGSDQSTFAAHGFDDARSARVATSGSAGSAGSKVATSPRVTPPAATSGPATPVTPAPHRVPPAAGSPARKSGHHSPRRRGKGKLSVNATRWVQVVVDGKARGATPLQGLVLSVGRHQVKLLDPKTRRVL
ncbi:MAG: protein kinase, partial [Deltaproteobacteria bacterium]|nr:protein kinase [Deltaproteobacteria bacterium]